MRALVLVMGLGLAACTDMPTSGVSPAAGQAPAGAQQAYFPAFPTVLFAAASGTCDGPGQTLVRPSRDQVRCESLPDPESAAAIILQFNGTVENLPKLVISISGRNTAEGYLVTAEHYINVPQRDGGTQQVRFPDLSVERDVRGLLTAAGGRPI